MHKWSIYLFASFLLLSLAVRLPAQPHNFLRYTVADGLPQSQIHAAISDSRGYLWLGAPGGGLSRFDGRNFDNFTTQDGLPSNVVQALFEDLDGRIWVGTAAGLAYREGDRFAPVQPPSTGPVSVTAIARQTDSSLWIGTDRGLFQYLKTTRRLEKAKRNVLLDQLPIRTFYPGLGGVWVATNRGAWRLGDTLIHIDREMGLAGEDVRAFTRGPDGQLWILTYDHYDQSVTMLNEALLQVTGSRQPPALVRALCAYTDAQNRVWIGTEDRGVFIYDPRDDRWERISEEEGAPHNHIRVILPDQWGNIWIATAGGGLARYLGQSFVHYTTRNGLPDPRIYALAEDRENRLWIATGAAGVTLYDEREGFRPLGRDSGLISVPVRTILADSRSAVWLGTDGLGLLRLDSAELRRFSTLEGLPANRITALAEDLEGNVWVATPADGLARLRPNLAIDRIGVEEDFDEAAVSTLQADDLGRVWFATPDGRIGYLHNGRLGALYGREAGLPGVAVRSLAFDRQGKIWAATAGAGLYFADTRSSPLSFQALQSAPDDLTSLNLNFLIFDRDDNLWAGHERGVDRISFDAAGDVTAIQPFSRNEGFPGQETYPGAALVDQRGDLWFGTADGLVRRSPADASPQPAAPRIHLQTISLFYRPLAETDFADWVEPGGIRPGLALPYRQNHLSFSFKGINLSNPEDVRYRWRLIGHETEWSPLSTIESVNYANLAPGNYVFEVQACSGPDHCSDQAIAAFQIRRPFWQRSWFYPGAGLLIAALVVFLFRRRLRNLQRREKAQREKLEMQNHLLQLEQKALQLQMNPHFLFNALNGIQSLVATGESEAARRQINRFAALMRIMLSNARKERISLQEEIDTLEKYLQMEQFCQRASVNWSISAAKGVNREDLLIPPMLVQPFVENAIIHGIAHRPEGGKIDILFLLEKDDLLTCRVTDNGVGRKRAAELRRPGHQSAAMDVTRERIETLLAGRPEKALEIEDLSDETGAPAGTRVILNIPVALRF